MSQFEFQNFNKKDKSGFEITAEDLKQIEMSNMAEESLKIVDDLPCDYEDKRWIEKSDSIKARDNYTCQLCHCFNPMQKDLVFVKQGKYDTVHRYYWAGDNYYDINVKGYILTITFHFYHSYHLVMPRLNVHHKVYYRNRELWDYQDDELVTLCEDCHHYIHSLKDFGIPIIEKNANGNNMLIGRTQPKSYNPVFDHTDLSTFKPLALVKENLWGDGLRRDDLIKFKLAQSENKQWYDYHEVFDKQVAYISYFTSYDRRINDHSPEEIKEVAEFVILDFIENILGFRKKNK